MSDARILIVGPGAMGCGMAALLKHRGADVALCDYRQDRAATITRDGLLATLDGAQIRAEVPCVTDASQLPSPDLVIVLVKSYHTPDVHRQLHPPLPRHAAVLTLQNGLGNHEELARHLPPDQVLAGTVVMGCASLGTGRVRISGIGQIALGSPYSNPSMAAHAADVLSRYWDEVAVVADIEAALWRKVMVNAAINPLTALSGLPNGALLDGGDLQSKMGRIATEVATVAAAVGIAIPGDPVAIVEAVCRLTAGNRTSMLQDIEAGRRTEIDYINGMVAQYARGAGIEAPLCQAMTGLVHALEQRSP